MQGCTETVGCKGCNDRLTVDGRRGCIVLQRCFTELNTPFEHVGFQFRQLTGTVGIHKDHQVAGGTVVLNFKEVVNDGNFIDKTVFVGTDIVKERIVDDENLCIVGKFTGSKLLVALLKVELHDIKAGSVIEHLHRRRICFAVTGEEDCDRVVFTCQLQELGDKLEFTVECEHRAVGFCGDKECDIRIFPITVGVAALDNDVGGLDGCGSGRGVLLGKRRVGNDIDIIDGNQIGIRCFELTRKAVNHLGGLGIFQGIERCAEQDLVMERDNVVCVIFDQIIDHGITSLGD